MTLFYAALGALAYHYGGPGLFWPIAVVILLIDHHEGRVKEE